MLHVSQRIHLHIPRYNWIGFYLLDKQDSTTLVLGPHAGSFTPAKRIALHQGLCGWAASTQGTIVADDVREEPRYVQASDLVKSQISVPLLVVGKAVGVFNVESYFLGAFKRIEDRTFVEACARIVAACYERTALSAPLVHV